MQRFKLPGGHVELGEKYLKPLCVKYLKKPEYRSEFIGIQGFGSKKVFRFGKSNIYFLCRLNALKLKKLISKISMK